MTTSGICMAQTKTVLAAISALAANDCDIDFDREGGTARVWDGDTLVYQAIQKGHGGPWIVRVLNSDRITWHQQGEES